MNKTLLCLIALAASVPALAAEKKPLIDVGGGQGYGMAGCGLGSIIFGEQKGMIQLVAATTNDIYSHQSFAISSGTSNCKDDGAKGTKTASLFITANREALEKDVARGGGETVSTLSELMGCQDTKTFGATLQSNYGKIFPSQNTSTETVVDSIVGTVQSDAELAKSCG
jgi:hypothetical protein